MLTGLDGITNIYTSRSVADVLAGLLNLLELRGITVFAVIDHSGEAARVGIEMPATKLVVFGNPKAGTPLMIAAPAIAIDLPLKILIADDQAGRTRISYNSPDYLQTRFGMSSELMGNIAVIEKIVTTITG